MDAIPGLIKGLCRFGDIPQLRGFPGSLQGARGLSSSHWQAMGAHWRLADDCHMFGLRSSPSRGSQHTSTTAWGAQWPQEGQALQSPPSFSPDHLVHQKVLEGGVPGPGLPRAQ